jgi:hypothetical protein
MPPRKRSGDLTGLETQRLQNEHAEELKAKANELTMFNAALELEKAEPVDYTKSSTPLPEIETQEVVLENPTRTIMVNTGLESVTFGAGNHYTFEEGRKYTVSKDLADHLASKGLLYEGYYR